MNLAHLDRHRKLVTTRRGDVSYLDTGSGDEPAALLVHGVGTNAYLWRNLLAEFEGERRAVALDLPTAITRSRRWPTRSPPSARRSTSPTSTSSPTTPAARWRRSSRPGTPSGSAPSP